MNITKYEIMGFVLIIITFILFLISYAVVYSINYDIKELKKRVSTLEHPDST